ncbi:MAG: tetratricopeptide repeat protein [Deltaproteobacteria bacterium]|nr:MAG: tetratricopeptide repeat protein [Deltaproteobacteria bacterium]
MIGARPRRSVALSLAIAGLVSATARADAVDDHLARGRELYERREFVHARDELLAAYQLDPRPEILFALGQVELNIGQFARAIDYYERFIATNPGADEVALAQQAIGAARARLAETRVIVAPPRPPPHPVWDVDDGDHSGTLSEYNDRLSQAATTQWAGAGCLAAGALAIGGAVLRWRLHLVDTEIQPVAGPRGAGVTWIGRW